jgi:drug/metabolite transporter (DMT)-like permease
MQTWAVFAGKNQLLGDLLCLGGAVLFAVVSVTQELVVKTLDWVEYLGMVGLFGSVISIVQTYVQILILINNQLDARFRLYIFISILYMFRATLCSSSGESIVSIQHLVYVILCR